MPTGIEELRSCLVPLRDPWLTAPNNVIVLFYFALYSDLYIAPNICYSIYI